MDNSSQVATLALTSESDGQLGTFSPMLDDESSLTSLSDLEEMSKGWLPPDPSTACGTLSNSFSLASGKNDAADPTQLTGAPLASIVCPVLNCESCFSSKNLRKSLREHIQKKHKEEFNIIEGSPGTLFSSTNCIPVSLEGWNKIRKVLYGDEIALVSRIDDIGTRKTAKRKRVSADFDGNHGCCKLNKLDDVEFPVKRAKRIDSDLKARSAKPRESSATATNPLQQEVASSRSPVLDSSQKRSSFIVLKHRPTPRLEIATVMPRYDTDPGLTKYTRTQHTSCLRDPEVKRMPSLQCVACTQRNWSSGGCRFEGIRGFAADGSYILTSNIELATDSYFLPKLSIVGDEQDAEALLRRIAPSLEDILRKEIIHQRNSRLQRKPREQDSRSLCDGCATTIFSGHWVCYICGREYCLDCFDEWSDDLKSSNSTHINQCVRRKSQKPQAHCKLHMIPYTRFLAGECEALLKEVVARLDQADIKQEAEPIPENTPIEGLPYATGDIKSISLETFTTHWKLGLPLRLAGFSDRFEIDWNPRYFVDKYGEEPAELVDVIKQEVLPCTIREFFVGLETGEQGSMKHLKLNDWPDVADFALAMPDLFHDFEGALPFPKYTRRGGFLNLAAWFPPRYLPPDLGPKLYCAGASSDAVDAQGTTVLHMDMTDAVNIMTWSGKKPEDREGCAVWDVFPQKDSEILRQYLLEKTSQLDAKILMDDPIRRARFYLHAGDLAQLESQYNVKPWRIYQNPGEAVFIPAGCAHQVCNLTPCIKVACDFVSPQNVHRCFSITAADRRLAALAKREDVLQLKNVIYFAFTNVLHRNDPRPEPAIEQTNSGTELRPAQINTEARRSTRRRPAQNYLETEDGTSPSAAHDIRKTESSTNMKPVQGISSTIRRKNVSRSTEGTQGPECLQSGISPANALEKLFDQFGFENVWAAWQADHRVQERVNKSFELISLDVEKDAMGSDTVEQQEVQENVQLQV